MHNATYGLLSDQFACDISYTLVLLLQQILSNNYCKSHTIYFHTQNKTMLTVYIHALERRALNNDYR